MRWLVGLVAVLLGACWGFPVDQSAECKTYAACIRALDRAAGQTTNLDRYDDGGACWGNPELGRACTTSCGRALERLRAREPSLPPECAP